ncbi:MAG: 1-acyl-sn-glycerol-3-phosphate acyltransferase [Deltaproteobacteria bacterium]|nr:MAG: 1-acyl-sn-glycerol-3-phosphate acyltransferase [Deltaproteobacteria bacterium]
MRLPVSIETPLRTAAGLLILPLGLVLCSMVAVVLALRGASAERLHRIYVGFARLCLRVGATRLEVHGADQIEAGRAYVVVSNHESAWDPPCIVAALPGVILRFVAKKAITDIPIFGHALKITGNVTVVRRDTARDVGSLHDRMAHRDPKVSMLFFAEGTRSRDGALHPFKMGAFATAIDSGLPILPVALAGTFAIWPKGTLRLRRSDVMIEVGAPIETQRFKFEERAELRDGTHRVMAELRRRARQRLRARGHDPAGTD